MQVGRSNDRVKPAESQRTKPAPDSATYPSLLTSLSILVERMRMLTGMAVAYGNRDHFLQAHVGNVQEVELIGGAFVPRVRPVRDSTLYDLASLTKIFTMIGVMQLVTSGELSLDDRIGAIDPRFPGLVQVRLEQAMSYEASLQTPERIDTQPDYEAALRQVFAMVVNPVESPRPYSDMNALALQYVVERVSGMSFYDYIEHNILRPAGMTETYSLVPPDRLGDCACYNYEHRILRHEYRMRSDVPLGVPHDPKAQILRRDGHNLCGHAGLFSTLTDMARLCQALLSEKLLPMDTVLRLSTDRRRNANPNGSFRQYLGMLCFIKGPQQRYSEVPLWMSDRAFAQSGYTGNHIAIDPERGVFDLFLGNRCHNRVAVVQPPDGVGLEAFSLDDQGVGCVPWPDGRMVPSSHLYVHQKDELLHRPIWEHLRALRWI